MKFSVIVPVYNVEKYLPQCVDSVLAQSFHDFELILVDDGSLDNCPALCDAYAAADSRVRVLHKSNGGLSDARNAGMTAALGEYVTFIDSDDYWSSTDVLNRMAEVLAENAYDVLQFGMRKLYADKIIPEPPAAWESFADDGQGPMYLHRAVCEKRLAISACSMMLSRQFLFQHELYFVKGLKSEDIEWGIRLFSEKPCVFFMQESFYVYRQSRKGSITSTIDAKHMDDYCTIIESSLSLLESKQEACLNSLLSYVMYHITVAAALCQKISLDCENRRIYKARLKTAAQNRLTKYTDDPRVKMALFFYRLGGFGLMSMVLGLYLKYRGR